MKIKDILLVVITMLVCTSGSIIATTLYYAKQVTYTPLNENLEVSDVDDALNELYNQQLELKNANKVVLLDSFSGVQTKTYTVPEGTTVDDVIIDVTSVSISAYASGAWADVSSSSSGKFYSKSITGTTLTVKTNSVGCSAKVGTMSTQGYAHSSGTSTPGIVKIYLINS